MTQRKSKGGRPPLPSDEVRSHRLMVNLRGSRLRSPSGAVALAAAVAVLAGIATAVLVLAGDDPAGDERDAVAQVDAATTEDRDPNLPGPATPAIESPVGASGPQEDDLGAEHDSAVEAETTVAFASAYDGKGTSSGIRVPVTFDPNRMYQAIFRDSIRPIYDPTFVTVDESKLDDGDHVIGLAVNGEARAYSVGVLTSREMVNDVVGGVPVLVTW